MVQKIWLGTALVLVILTTSFYLLMPEKVRIDFTKTRTIFKVYEEGKFVTSGIEYVRIFDGTRLMRAKNRTIDYTILDSKTMAGRISSFKDRIIIEDSYDFDNEVINVENVPISHKVCFTNSKGKIFEYMIDRIEYDGETKDITSPFSFGKNMKLTFQDGYYRAKVYNYKYATDKIKIRYRVTDDYQCFDVRLFDPETEEKLTEITYKDNNMTIEFKVNDTIIGQATLKSHKTYDEVGRVTIGKNRTVIWYEFTDFKDVKIDALKGVEFIDMRKEIFNYSGKEILNESEIDKYIVPNPNYLLSIEKNYSFVYLNNKEWVNYISFDIPKENIIIGVQTDLFWGEFIDVRFNIFENKLDRHAVVVGVSAGFVEEAPQDDPGGSDTFFSGDALGFKDTSPATAGKVIEIGWWAENPTEESNFEVAIYDHDSGSDIPKNIVGSKSATNAKGTDAGWKRVTGLDITISSSTVYWIGVQHDSTATATLTNYNAGGRMSFDTSSTTLVDPWVSDGTVARILAFYAVWEVAGPEDTCSCPDSGDWIMTDNCNITTDCDLQGNDFYCEKNDDVSMNAVISNFGNIFSYCDIFCIKTPSCFG